jgi:hypothetical protein
VAKRKIPAPAVNRKLATHPTLLTDPSRLREYKITLAKSVFISKNTSASSPPPLPPSSDGVRKATKVLKERK